MDLEYFRAALVYIYYRLYQNVTVFCALRVLKSGALQLLGRQLVWHTLLNLTLTLILILTLLWIKIPMITITLFFPSKISLLEAIVTWANVGEPSAQIPNSLSIFCACFINNFPLTPLLKMVYSWQHAHVWMLSHWSNSLKHKSHLHFINSLTSLMYGTCQILFTWWLRVKSDKPHACIPWFPPILSLHDGKFVLRMINVIKKYNNDDSCFGILKHIVKSLTQIFTNLFISQERFHTLPAT